MLFNSYEFLLGFLPAALVVTWLADRWPGLRIWTLVALSIVFYGYWDYRFVPLLVGSILVNWLAVKLYQRGDRRGVLVATIVFDLLVLAVFKYADFFVDSFNSALGTPFGQLGWTLPLGISFFTFHHVMYLVDLRRGRAPIYSLDRYALYICFFPQAIAGPLARWHEIMHQFGQSLACPGWERRCALGATFIVAGLAEKVVLGDGLARHLDPIYERALGGPVLDGSAWLTLATAFQVFFDFGGYSDIAIGLGLIFGVQLPLNFDGPFRATSIVQLWRRWHMTLSRFLRDYLFLPLAQSQAGRTRSRFRFLRQSGAILATMALCGLWHGAGWQFVVWGTLQGGAMIFATAWQRRVPASPAVLGWAATIGFFVASGILFRAGSLDAAWNIYQGWAMLPARDGLLAIFPIAAIAATCAIALPPSHVLCHRLNETPRLLAAAGLGLAGAVLLIQLGGEPANEFVDFRF